VSYYDPQRDRRRASDPLEDTRPTITSNDHLSDYQPIPVEPEDSRRRKPRKERRPRKRRSRAVAKLWIFVIVFLAAYLLAPFNTNILILGLDRVPEGTYLGRSDTIIVAGIRPLSGEVRMLSIPRDLWVPIPGYGEQRINAAHYFAEANQAGGGPAAAAETIEFNFGIPIHYYVRFRLEGFAGVVDAFGGIDISLDAPTGKYPAGDYHFNGEEALAFVRDRTGDDFFRMQHGQIFVRAGLRKLINPLTWLRLPGTLIALGRAIDHNVPAWQLPRLGLAALRAGPEGIDTRSLDRTMASGYTTADGAAVLLPYWPAITPMVDEMFGWR
jgi:LCP family protein required for cell wall assembly